MKNVVVVTKRVLLIHDETAFIVALRAIDNPVIKDQLRNAVTGCMAKYEVDDLSLATSHNVENYMGFVHRKTEEELGREVAKYASTQVTGAEWIQ